jgi:hypothetical protein
MNDIRELTDAELDIVGGGGHHHHSSGDTLNLIVNFDVGQIGNQVAGTQNNWMSSVGLSNNHGVA